MLFEQWKKTESCNPKDYFNSRMRHYGFTPDQTSKITAIDFKTNNYFVINGLYLGKTEAALIAYLGSRLSSC
jgi:hypothetical protein